jgi:uracil-DNA glycosylase family 4
MSLIEVNCKQENCPVFNKCCFLPTTFFPIDNKVNILFIGMGGGSDERKQGRPFVGPAGKRLKTCILKSKSIWGKPFGVGFSNTIRDNPDKNRAPNQNELDFCLKYLFRDIKRLKKVYDLRVVMPLGNHAKSVFIDNKIGITLDRKNIYTVNNESFGSIIVKPSLHPSFLIRKGSFNSEGIDKILIDDILESLQRINI